MNNYIQQLNHFGVEYLPYNGAIYIFCPTCRYGEITGNKMATVYLDQQRGITECRNCGEKLVWANFIAKFTGEKPIEMPKPAPQITLPDAGRGKMLRVSAPPYEILSVGEILARDFGEEVWLIDRLVPATGIVALSGNPGEFKTWITNHVALCIGNGTAVFGQFSSKQGPVLVIDEENQLRDIKRRYELLQAKSNVPIFYLSLTSFRADTKERVAEISAIIKERRIALVIIDSLVRIHGQQENDATQMAAVFKGLQQFAKDGAAVIFTHHNWKRMGYYKAANPAQDMRGSSDILAAVDGHISVERKENEDILILRQNKARTSEQLSPFEVSIVKDESGPTAFVYKGNYDEKKKKADEAAGAVAKLLAEGIKSRGEIEDALGNTFGKGAVSEGIKMAMKVGDIELVPKDELSDEQKAHSRRKYYRFVGEEDPPAL